MDACESDLIAEVIASGWVTQGPRVEEFERVFAEYVGAKHAIAMTSCTTGLHAALLAYDIGEGDEVIVPSMSFIASANVIRHANATPVFAEVDRRTFNLDPNVLEDAITPRTKAIMPVHQIGMPADLAAILEIARRRRLVVIEDAACATGSEILWNGVWERIGKPHGEIAAFSFHPRKLITTGEGGMLTTNDDQIAERLRRLRHHGMSVSDRARHGASKMVLEEYVEVAYNYRMTDMQGAMGLAQMEKLPTILAKRRELAANYSAALAGIEAYEPPYEPPYTRSNFQSYAVGLTTDAPISRNDLMDALLERGISTRRGIMTSHREPAYADARRDVKLPITERASDQTLLLPMYTQMTDAEQRYVIDALIELGTKS